MPDPSFAEPANRWPDIPPGETHEESYARLAWWQRRREAAEREKALVQAALAKAAKDRTAQDEAVIAYSIHGTASSCGCRPISYARTS